MTLALVFLGPLEDVAGVPTMTLDIDGPVSLADIAERLEPELAVAITAAKVRLALNGNVVSAAEMRADNGDELAFLPPVSGG